MAPRNMAIDKYIPWCMFLYMKHVHIGLHDQMMRDLEDAAAQEQTNKTQIIRRAITLYLKQREQRLKHERMRRYAESMAPHSAEFVSETEGAVVAQLLNETEW